MRKQITPNYKFKNAGKYPKHHKIQKNNIFLLTNCLTQLYDTFIPTCFGCILFDRLFKWQRFCHIIFYIQNRKIIHSFLWHGFRNSFFITDGVEKFFFRLHYSIPVISCKFLGLLSNLGKPLSRFFHIWDVRFQGISMALLGPLPGP